jgi:hypothetical protein
MRAFIQCDVRTRHTALCWCAQHVRVRGSVERARRGDAVRRAVHRATHRRQRGALDAPQHGRAVRLASRVRRRDRSRVALEARRRHVARRGRHRAQRTRVRERASQRAHRARCVPPAARLDAQKPSTMTCRRVVSSTRARTSTHINSNAVHVARSARAARCRCAISAASSAR